MTVTTNDERAASELRFGSYRVVETLGAGALSTIYKAVQEPLGRTVALKALKTQIAPTSSFGDQLEREAKILVDLVHPNVVLLLESSRTSTGRPYVVLEHIDGPSLHDVLAKTKRLSVEAALAIACGICSALEHVHGHGVVHRDVKPSNVLLARSGVVKMIDFGIAQRPRTASLSDAFGTEGITPSGRMAPEQLKDAFGTPAYMSPEQILGDFVDGRSDLFSLGVVMYQMLSGSRPFEGKGDTKGAAQRIRRDPPPDLKTRAPDVPRAAERIVMRLLEKAPNDRYPNANAVRERLLQALRAETRDEESAIVRRVLVDAGFIAEGKQASLRESTGERPFGSTGERPFGSTGERSFGSTGERSFGSTGERSFGSTGEGVRSSERSLAPRRRPFLRGMWKAVLGFAAIGVLFVAGVFAIEGPSWSARDRGKMSELGSTGDRSMGGVRVVATPWAYVRVDGQDMETTPFARPIPLAQGKHWVTLTHPDSPAVDREIEVVSGEIVMLDVTMPIGDADAGASKDAR